MATALIIVTIPGLTNAEVDDAPRIIEALLKKEWLKVEVEVNGDTEYDKEDSDE